MTYYVYENWIHNKAVIHSSDCSRCNDGKGMFLKKKYDSKRGHWLGPFKERQEAELVARKTKRKFIFKCSFCNKS